MKQEVLYFGCWPGSIGRRLYRQDGSAPRYAESRREEERHPWIHNLDSLLLRAGASWLGEPEGQGLLVQEKGWTCFSFWCRRFDTRANSNSAFLIKAVVDFQELLAAAEGGFPQIFAHLKGLELKCGGESYIPDYLREVLVPEVGDVVLLRPPRENHPGNEEQRVFPAIVRDLGENLSGPHNPLEIRLEYTREHPYGVGYATVGQVFYTWADFGERSPGIPKEGCWCHRPTHRQRKVLR
jgi:hypothetical protein